MPWAGLGVLGNGVTWTLMPTSAGVMEHELGHNYGLNHGKTSKGERAGEDFNTPQWSGMSRISGGGSVYWQEERSRFNDNGHFGMGPKHWFGWIEDDHVVRMHPTTSGCPTAFQLFQASSTASTGQTWCRAPRPLLISAFVSSMRQRRQVKSIWSIFTTAAPTPGHVRGCLCNTASVSFMQASTAAPRTRATTGMLVAIRRRWMIGKVTTLRLCCE